jgi:hypothetical protein
MLNVLFFLINLLRARQSNSLYALMAKAHAGLGLLLVVSSLTFEFLQILTVDLPELHTEWHTLYSGDC